MRVLLRPQDLERSLRFYVDTLGLAVYREWGEGKTRGVVFFLGGGLLEVSSTSPEPPSDAVRLFLQVRDPHAVRERLAERGVPIEEEPRGEAVGPLRDGPRRPRPGLRRGAARAPAQTAPVARAISRGANWPWVGSAQQHHGSVSRGLPSTEPQRIGSWALQLVRLRRHDEIVVM
jgi:catechol 2,3-dioxygenase-like lactoylglutathione lyase family enzyme